MAVVLGLGVPYRGILSRLIMISVKAIVIGSKFTVKIIAQAEVLKPVEMGTDPSRRY